MKKDRFNTRLFVPPPEASGGARGSRRSLTFGGDAARLRAALAALVLTLVALASTSAAAQTITISASGNCGGTPANCGTADNRNGDRDTAWPGLQVDEGDVFFLSVLFDQSIGVGKVLAFTYSVSGSAWLSLDLAFRSGTVLGSSGGTLLYNHTHCCPVNGRVGLEIFM